MTIWAEAYDLPHLADPGKKIAWLPALDYQWGRHADVFREEGSVSLPAAYERLNEVHLVDPSDHGNDVGSVIHLFQRGILGSDGLPIPAGSFVVERRPDEMHSKAVSITQLSGRGLTAYFLDRVRLWPYDHPVNPTKEGDWIFGGDNILTNPGLEDGTPQGEQWAIWFDDAVDGGQWHIDLDGDPTAAIEWDATGGDIKDAIELGITAIITVSVTGEGTESDPFLVQVSDPTDNLVDFTVVDDSLTSGTVYGEVTRQGGIPDISGWSRSINLARQSTDHGRYASDGFRLTVSGEPVHSGDYALRINGLSVYAGAQQILNVIPGHRYTVSYWIYTGNATNHFRMVIRDRFENFVAGPQGPAGFFKPTVSTWTQVIFEFTAPSWASQVVLRVAVVGDDIDGLSVNPDPFYLDDLSFAPGTGPATIGDIWEQLLLDAQTDHDGEGRDALSWLVPTFNTTTDSNGDPWDTTRKLTLQVDDTYGQIAEAIQRLWGYVQRIRYDREDNLYYFDVFNPGYQRVDQTATTTGTLTVGMNISGGEAITRNPQGSHFKTRGEDGTWAEGTDTDLLPAWGWADGEVLKPATSDPDALGDVITRMLALNLEQMISIETSMQDRGQVTPIRDIDLFDLVTLNLGASSSIPATDMTITSIVVSGKPGQPANYQVYVNSDAFASTGAAALAEAVRRLLRRSQRRTQDFGGLAGIAGSSGVPRIVVATINGSSNESIQKADFVCYGDDLEVFQAIAGIFDDGLSGELRLTEGIFHPDGADITWAAVFISGAGEDASFISLGETDTWTMSGNSGFRDLSFGEGGG